MTVFDLMPSIWLLSSFIFLLFYLLCDIDPAVCCMSTCLICLAASLTGAFVRLQCTVFFALLSVLLIVYLYSSRKRRSHARLLAIAVTDILPSGGYVRINGKTSKAYCRDCCVRYRKGQVFTLETCKGNDILISSD